MKRAWLYILLFLITACAKEADWTPKESSQEIIIVEGTITNESRTQYIKLHHSQTDQNVSPVPVSGAEVIINNVDSTWQLYEDPEEAGKYISESLIVAQLGKNYSLIILYQNHFYSALSYMVPGKTFLELSYEKNEDDDLYHINYVASAFEEDDPAMWEIQVDWSSVPGYQGFPIEETRKRLLFYTLTTLDVSQIFAPLVEEISFPAGTKINQRRYSLNPQHADFVRSLLLETSWQGGVFPSDPANVITNLSEGAMGYFGVCAVNSLSLTVTP